jgi:hypothetical protein
MTTLSPRPELVGATESSPVAPSLARKVLGQIYDCVSELLPVVAGLSVLVDADRGAQELVGVYHGRNMGAWNLPDGWEYLVTHYADRTELEVKHSFQRSDYTCVVSPVGGAECKLKSQTTKSFTVIAGVYDPANPGGAGDFTFSLYFD